MPNTISMSDDFVSFNSNMTGVTIETGPANPIGAPELTPGFDWGSCYSTINFLHILAIVLSVLRLMDSDYLFGIFKDFLNCYFLTSLSRKQDRKNIWIFILSLSYMHLLPHMYILLFTILSCARIIPCLQFLPLALF